jgi:acyl carrier protein
MNRPDVTAYLQRVVAERLGRPVGAGDALLDQPGFDSLAIVAVIDRVETDLGLELDPDLLVPETFTDLGTLTEAVCRSDPRSTT